MTEPKPKRKDPRPLSVSLIEGAICAIVAACVTAAWVFGAVTRRGRKRRDAEREPTTVEELVNSASAAGPVTVVMPEPGGRMLN